MTSGPTEAYLIFSKLHERRAQTPARKGALCRASSRRGRDAISTARATTAAATVTTAGPSRPRTSVQGDHAAAPWTKPT